MKKTKFTTLILLILLIICYFYRSEIVNFALGNIFEYAKVEAPTNNDYAKDYKFEFVSTTDNFHVKNTDDIKNVLYTFLNSGEDSFTFYCSKNYKNCIPDLQDISKNQTLLSVINNMVSPYNSYEKMYFSTTTYGKITVKIDKLYSKEDIKKLNEKLGNVENEIINSNMGVKDKIRAYHDYLINNTVYDENRANQIEKGKEDNFNNSHKATGPLLEGMALCSGYSDAMKLFLDHLNIPNYKISNDNHIWNLVYVDDKWLHLDLTWDDPVTSDNSNILLHEFFLIDTDTLQRLDTTNHEFNKEYYIEAK